MTRALVALLTGSLLLATACTSDAGPSVSTPSQPPPGTSQATMPATTATTQEQPVEAEATWRTIDLPIRDGLPQAIAVDGAGRVWVTLLTANMLLAYDPQSDAFAQWPIPTPNAQPFDVAIAPDDVIWLTYTGRSRIARFDPATGAFTEFTPPTPNAGPHSIAFAPDGAVWFSEPRAGAIARLDPRTGEVQEPVQLAQDARPADLAIGPDGVVWWTSLQGDGIGRYDPSTGTPTALPPPDGAARHLLVDNQGDLWFTVPDEGLLGHRRADGRVETFPLPEDGAQPAALALDRDGRVWLSDIGGRQLLRFDPTTATFATHPLPNPDVECADIATGPSGDIWCLASTLAMLVQLVPPPSA